MLGTMQKSLKATMRDLSTEGLSSLTLKWQEKGARGFLVRSHVSSISLLPIPQEDHEYGTAAHR